MLGSPQSFSSLLHRVSLWVVLAFLCSFIVRFMLLLDLNKRTYNHTPGPCRALPDVSHGASSMSLVAETDQVFATFGFEKSFGVKKTPVGVFLYEFSKDGAESPNYNTKELEIEGKDIDMKDLVPVAISTNENKGRIAVYLATENLKTGNFCVQIFQFNKEKLCLIHRKSVCDPAFTSLSSISAMGSDRFYVTNLAYSGKGWMQNTELFMQSSFGALLFFDGQKTLPAVTRLASPSAVAVDSQRNLLYVASLMNENIRVYRMNKDFSLEFKVEIGLLSSPSGIHVDKTKGELWVSLHPVFYQTFFFLHDRENRKSLSSSQILRVRMQEDGVSWVITEPYANDGATISASSAVVYHKDQLLIGSMFGRLIHCDVLNPQIT